VGYLEYSTHQDEEPTQSEVAITYNTAYDRLGRIVNQVKHTSPDTDHQRTTVTHLTYNATGQVEEERTITHETGGLTDVTVLRDALGRLASEKHVVHGSGGKPLRFTVYFSYCCGRDC
jgi:hypothetical protein